MAGPLDFWKIVKEVNPGAIRAQASVPFNVAALGDGESLPALRRVAGLATPEARQWAGDHWHEAFLPLGPEARYAVSGCAFALAMNEDVGDAPVVTWSLPTNPAPLARDVKAILDRFPHLSLALPRYIPMFRHEATDRVISATATANAKIALASALPGVLPWTAALLPATSLPDMILLTKDQAMMCLRIAAAYGLPVEPAARFKELGSIAGAAFGWRALARELVGAVPGGVGVALKGAIAYAGTVATGRAAQAFYETGRRPTDTERRAVYDEALAKGRTVATDILNKLRHNPEPEPATA